MMKLPKPRFPQDKDIRFHGIHRGKVLDNNDPEKLCRLKVKVWDVYDELPDEHIPWAEACTLSGGSNNNGFVAIPPINSDVFIMFYHGDWHYPIWMGCFFGSPNQILETPKPVIADNTDPIAQDSEVSESANWNPEYPHNQIWRTPNSKLTIELDDTLGEERIHIWHSSGTHMEYRANGDAIEHVFGNVQRIVDGNVVETIKGNYTSTIQGNQTKTIQGRETRTISQFRNTTITQDDTRNVLSAYDTINANKTELITGQYTSVVGSNLFFTVTGTVNISAVSATQQFVLGSGTASMIFNGITTMNVNGTFIRNATVSIADNAPAITHN